MSSPGKYGNRRAHRESRGHGPQATVMIGVVAATKAAKNRNLTSGPRPTPENTATCPVCGLGVRVIKQGTILGSHQVGKNRKQAWPCPGAGQPAQPVE
jgi:hypothetical protein